MAERGEDRKADEAPAVPGLGPEQRSLPEEVGRRHAGRELA